MKTNREVLDRLGQSVDSMLKNLDSGMFIEERASIVEACSRYVIARVVADLDQEEPLHEEEK